MPPFENHWSDFNKKCSKSVCMQQTFHPCIDFSQKFNVLTATQRFNFGFNLVKISLKFEVPSSTPNISTPSQAITTVPRHSLEFDPHLSARSGRTSERGLSRSLSALLVSLVCARTAGRAVAGRGRGSHPSFLPSPDLERRAPARERRWPQATILPSQISKQFHGCKRETRSRSETRRSFQRCIL